MTVGEIIFAVLVGMQALFFLIGFGLIIACLVKKGIKISDKIVFTAYIFFAISPIFSIVGAFFGFLL